MELKPGYKQTEVGVIPEDWDVISIGKACKLINGRGFKPHEWEKTGLPIIRIQNLNGSSEYNHFLGNYNPKIEVANGQLLFAWSGSRGSSFGPHIWHGAKALLNYHTWKVEINERVVQPCFFYHALKKLTALIEEKAHGASALVHTQKWEMEKLPIVIPICAREQAEIADALTECDKLLSDLEALLQKKRNIKQAAMQELLTGKRRLPGFEGEWGPVSLGSVAAMNSGGTPPTGRDDFYGGGIPWVSISDMTSSGRFISETERTLSDLGLANCSAKRFPSGTILYAMYASLGECSIAAREVTTSQAILGIRPGSSLVGEYLYYWLESIRGAVKLMGQQGTQSNLNKKIVQGFSLGLPSKAEQAAIAKVLSEIDQDIDTLKVKAEKTRAMKAGMLQQLLTGKIRLK